MAGAQKTAYKNLALEESKHAAGFAQKTYTSFSFTANYDIWLSEASNSCTVYFQPWRERGKTKGEARRNKGPQEARMSAVKVDRAAKHHTGATSTRSREVFYCFWPPLFKLC